MKKFLIPLTFAALCVTPVLARAMDEHAGHGASTAHADIYAKDMETMHKDMSVKPTGDADVDFVQSMIPHHEGAVAMAKTLLEKGKDPELHKLAEDIIKAQEKEIAFMKDWLKKHPAK